MQFIDTPKREAITLRLFFANKTKIIAVYNTQYKQICKIKRNTNAAQNYNKKKIRHIKQRFYQGVYTKTQRKRTAKRQKKGVGKIELRSTDFYKSFGI